MFKKKKMPHCVADHGASAAVQLYAAESNPDVSRSPEVMEIHGVIWADAHLQVWGILNI